ncbi:MAG: DUF5829 family protein [Bacteroidota bacterium]
MKFNHLYVVVDSSTFLAIKNELTKTQFANIDKGLPRFAPPDSNSNRMYIRGRQTYLEIMSSNNAYNEPEGKIGLGFSFDTRLPFNADISERTATKDCPEFKEHDAHYTFNDSKILWYKAYYTERQSNLPTWYAFYHPEFLNTVFSKGTDIYNRETFLEAGYSAEKPFTDIAAIELACNPEDYIAITNEWKCLGIQASSVSEEEERYMIDRVELVLRRIDNGNSSISRIKLAAKNERLENKHIGKVQLIGDPTGLSMIF